MPVIPAHTRIIVVPDGGASHEYGISRPMVVIILGLVLVFCCVLALLMVSFATKQDERRAIRVLEQQLTDAVAEVQTARALRTEIEEMRSFQERLLLMLGIDPTVEADPGSTAAALGDAAAISFSPRPDRWPAAGELGRGYNPGNTVQGVKPHLGVDIQGVEGAPVVAAADGIVDRIGTDEFLGNFVEIRHGLGYLTVYGHCSHVTVARGDRIEAGQTVATMGRSGEAETPQLHFEIWHQGEAVDPRTVIAGEPAPD